MNKVWTVHLLRHCGGYLSGDDVVNVAQQAKLRDTVAFRGGAEGGTGVDL